MVPGGSPVVFDPDPVVSPLANRCGGAAMIVKTGRESGSGTVVLVDANYAASSAKMLNFCVDLQRQPDDRIAAHAAAGAARHPAKTDRKRNV
jgi:hypothetical protein